MAAVTFLATLVRDEGSVGVRRKRKIFSLRMPDAASGWLAAGLAWDLSAHFTTGITGWKFLSGAAGYTFKLGGTALPAGDGHTSATNVILGYWVNTTTNGAALAAIPNATDLSALTAVLVEVEGY